MPNFCFIDSISEIVKNENLTAYFTLKGSEEFLKDHFENFPVMPGVLLLEALKQAASKFLFLSGDLKSQFFRLARVDEVRFGQFVKPGSRLKVFIRFLKKESGLFFFEGRIDLVNAFENSGTKKALTADFALAPIG